MTINNLKKNKSKFNFMITLGELFLILDHLRETQNLKLRQEIMINI